MGIRSMVRPHNVHYSFSQVHLGLSSLAFRHNLFIFSFNQNIQAGVLDNTFEPKVMKDEPSHLSVYFFSVGRRKPILGMREIQKERTMGP